MARERHLSRAPIREAVLDLRFPSSDIELDAIRQTLSDLDEFEQVSEIRQGSATFRFSLEGESEGQVGEALPIGFRGATEDGLWVAQLRRDGLTLSRLQPYRDWSEFSERGYRYAERLVGLITPERVDRLALRYVNHFRLPHPARMEDYFVGLPQIPASLPQFVSKMLSRVTLHDPTRDFSAHVTHSLVDDLDPEKMGFILDIDAFQTAEFPSDIEALRETFENLRVFKNQIFFEMITEQNAELHE